MYALQPDKKSRGCTNVFAAIGLVAVGITAILGLFVFVIMIGASAASTGHSSAHRVIYKVTTARDWGDCYGFDATYEMPSGTAQRSISICDKARSAVVDQRSAHSGDFVYLSVQNDKMSALIGCEIYVDGKLAYQTHSEGQYVIASCSGSVP